MRLGGAYRLGLTTIAFGSSGATTLAFNLVLARKLGPHSFGEVARTYSLGMAVAQVTMASISPALSYAVGHGGHDARRFGLSRTSLRLITTLAGGVAVLYVPLAFVGFAPTTALSLVLGTLLAFIYAVYFGLKLQLFVLDRVMLYAVAELAVDVIFFALLALLAFTDPHAGVLTFVVAYGLFIGGIGIYLRRRAPEPTPLADRREVTRYATLSFFGAYSTVARFPLVIGLTGILADSASSGKIAAIFAIVMPLFLVPQAASMLTFASVARAQGRDDHGSVREMTSVVTLISGVTLMFCALFAKPILDVVLGSQYSSVSSAFVVVAIGLAPQLAALPVGNAISAVGNVALNAAVAALGLPVAVVACLIAVPSHHVLGAAIAVSVSHVMMGVALIYFGQARFRLDLGEIAATIGLVCLGAAAAALDAPTALRIVLLAGTAAAVAVRLRSKYIGKQSLVPGS